MPVEAVETSLVTTIDGEVHEVTPISWAAADRAAATGAPVLNTADWTIAPSISTPIAAGSHGDASG